MTSVLLLASLAGGCVEARLPEPATSGDTVTAEATALIGEVDGASEYLFGDVSAVAAGRDRVIYVGDRIGSTVRAYDQTGDYLGTVGAAGEGPGEFNLPADITFDPSGRLYVRDATRITVFEHAEDQEFANRVVRTVQLGSFSPESRRGLATGTRYYFPTYLRQNFVTERYLYEVFDSLGATGDTVPVPALPGMEFLGRASFMISEGTGQPVPGVNQAPFEPRPHWAITPDGTVVTSGGSGYEIFEWDPTGDSLLAVRRQARPRTIPVAWARDSGEAFRRRLDSIPVPLDQVRGMSDAARREALPDHLPPITALHVGGDGNIWIGRWPPAADDDQTYFDVWGRDGVFLGTVRVPAQLQASPPPFLASDLIVGVLTDPDTGVQRVGVFAVPGW